MSTDPGGVVAEQKQVRAAAATVLVLNGAGRGEWYPVLPTRPLIMGRDDALLADVRDPRVSRRHLELRFDSRDQRYLVVDLHSRNGVTVNGDRVQGGRGLNDGDVLQLGHTVLAFVLRDFDDDAAAQACLRRCQEKHHALLQAVDAQAQGRGDDGDAASAGGFLGFHFFRRRR